jgi:CelD/BcsL family acetyltransferase involved in cellulose biosynthesis
MIRFASHLAAAAAVSFMLAGAAVAQTPAATAPTTPAAKSAPADTKAEKPRTAASLDCSKQADAKGLHGTARRKFRSECKKTAKAN